MALAILPQKADWLLAKDAHFRDKRSFLRVPISQK